MQEDVINGDTISCTYYSLDELADAAVRRKDTGGHELSNDDGKRQSWAGGSFNSAVELARVGWDEKLPNALAIAESAISKVEKTHEVKTFVPVWDVSGAEVDVARYLSGEPENMIDYPMLEVSKLGKVITICASIAVSGSVEADTLIRRGEIIAAFAMMVTRLGYSTELWVDGTSRGYSHGGDNKKKKFCMKTLVKGTNDTIDPARIVFAYAHPGMLRSLWFAVQNGIPEEWFNCFGSMRGVPISCIETLPEGTIYLPELCSGKDVPDADVMLLDLLKQAGLVES